MVVVISPLIALMESHVQEATSMGINAVQFPANITPMPGDVDIMFGSPEF